VKLLADKCVVNVVERASEQESVQIARLCCRAFEGQQQVGAGMPPLVQALGYCVPVVGITTQPQPTALTTTGILYAMAQLDLSIWPVIATNRLASSLAMMSLQLLLYNVHNAAYCDL